MTNFIINPYSISFESIRDDLMTYVSSKADYAGWRDFFAAGAGQTLIELMAALGSMYAYQFILGRREAFLSTAQNYSSQVGSAAMLGYNTFRGTNVRANVPFIATTTAVLPKWTMIGTYQEYDVVLTDELILTNGSQATAPVVIGKFKEELINVTTAALTQFKFSNPGTTDDARLLLNGVEVPTTTSIQEAINDKYVLVSNVYGSVDCLYLQLGDYAYKAGDTLTLQFIERNSIETVNPSSFALFYGDVALSASITSPRADKESDASIKLKAPIGHELGAVIRSRKDYPKYVLKNSTNLISTGSRDIYPGLINLSYVTKAGTLLTDTEKQALIESIELARPDGVARAVISDPKKIHKHLIISITKLSESYISSEIVNYVDAILTAYANVLGESFDLHLLEYAIDRVVGVKISRVTVGINTWAANTHYGLYDNVTSTDGDETASYTISELIYKSGSTEPAWPTTIGDMVTDNKLVWTKVNESVITLGVTEWQADSIYNLYSYVRPVDNTADLYRCTGIINHSGATEPTWGDEIVNDNEIIWELGNTGNQTVATWAAGTNYIIGSRITPVDTEDTSVYTCIGFRAKSGSIEPTWDNIIGDKTVDGQVTWTAQRRDASTINLDWDQFLSFSRDITIL
jgi:hypothetical protein